MGYMARKYVEKTMDPRDTVSYIFVHHLVIKNNLFRCSKQPGQWITGIAVPAAHIAILVSICAPLYFHSHTDISN